MGGLNFKMIQDVELPVLSAFSRVDRRAGTNGS